MNYLKLRNLGCIKKQHLIPLRRGKHFCGLLCGLRELVLCVRVELKWLSHSCVHLNSSLFRRKRSLCVQRKQTEDDRLRASSPSVVSCTIDENEIFKECCHDNPIISAILPSINIPPSERMLCMNIDFSNEKHVCIAMQLN